MTLNLVVFLNVGITNRLTGTNATDVSLTVDSGSGPVPSVAGLLQSSKRERRCPSCGRVRYELAPPGEVARDR